ncbi:hypothetical protein ACFQV2_22155 [Actinokineospora soli]|uniref:Uncharacterized protein n=1 Tax=Actinokineospora soli TaxID=1048753 RepID=A0ABW2TSJ3_9PSEU
MASSNCACATAVLLRRISMWALWVSTIARPTTSPARSKSAIDAV